MSAPSICPLDVSQRRPSLRICKDGVACSAFSLLALNQMRSLLLVTFLLAFEQQVCHFLFVFWSSSFELLQLVRELLP